MHWLECMQLEMWIPLLSCNLYMFDPLLCSFCLIVIKLHTPFQKFWKDWGWVDLLILTQCVQIEGFLFFQPMPSPSLSPLTPTAIYLSLSPHLLIFNPPQPLMDYIHPQSLLICPFIFLNIFINLQPIFFPKPFPRLISLPHLHWILGQIYTLMPVPHL